MHLLSATLLLFFLLLLFLFILNKSAVISGNSQCSPWFLNGSAHWPHRRFFICHLVIFREFCLTFFFYFFLRIFIIILLFDFIFFFIIIWLWTWNNLTMPRAVGFEGSASIWSKTIFLWKLLVLSFIQCLNPLTFNLFIDLFGPSDALVLRHRTHLRMRMMMLNWLRVNMLLLIFIYFLVQAFLEDRPDKV